MLDTNKLAKQYLINKGLDEEIKALHKEVFGDGQLFDYKKAAKNIDKLRKLNKLTSSKDRLVNSYLTRKINSFQKENSFKIDGEYKEIREMVSYAEDFIEDTLENLIHGRFQEKAKSHLKSDFIDSLMFRSFMLDPFFKVLSLREKVRVAKKFNVIKNNEAKIIYEFIEVRNFHSHPAKSLLLLSRRQKLTRIWSAIMLGKKLSKRKIKTLYDMDNKSK